MPEFTAPGIGRQSNTVEIVTDIAGIAGIDQPGTGTNSVDGGETACTCPAGFSASETFDVGVDLGFTVSLEYFDKRPFESNGTIRSVKVKLGK